MGLILGCDSCGNAMKWKCPHCGAGVYCYTATTVGYELGLAGSFALGFLGPFDWRTQILAADGLDHMNERAIQCNLCGQKFKTNAGWTIERAFRCREPGCNGHYTIEVPYP